VNILLFVFLVLFFFHSLFHFFYGGSTSLLNILISCWLIKLPEALRTLCFSLSDTGLLLESCFELWPGCKLWLWWERSLLVGKVIRLEEWFEWLFLVFQALLRHMSLSSTSEACASNFAVLFLCFGISALDLCKFWSVNVHKDYLVVSVGSPGLGCIPVIHSECSCVRESSPKADRAEEWSKSGAEWTEWKLQIPPFRKQTVSDNSGLLGLDIAHVITPYKAIRSSPFPPQDLVSRAQCSSPLPS